MRWLWLGYLAAVWELSAAAVMMPRLVGDAWQIAADPDLGRYTDPKQQPVDFALWQAGDGKWQLWSCIRGTKCGGKTRLFHRWEGAKLMDTNWEPRGIAMEASSRHGETHGGLQAPHVVKINGYFYMFYGDWENICVATSLDGKSFARRLHEKDLTGLFTEGLGNNTRDAMVIKLSETWHCYYTAFPNKQGAVYCRTSRDTRNWSASRIVAFGGEAGTDPYSAECPFVVELTPGEFYLFRTQRYGENAITRVYHSKDPMDFGVNNDSKHLVCSLPVAAPELIFHENHWYMASLLPSLKGIRVSRLDWVERK